MRRHSNPQNIRRLDHLGIVAGVIDAIGLVEVIDRLIPPAPQRIVSCGNAVKAMIINALGFVSRPLYMHPQFFDGKPVEHLFRSHTTNSGIESPPTILDLPEPGEEEPRVLSAEHFNDASLGRALDDLFEAGTSAVYFHVASQALQTVASMNRPFRKKFGQELGDLFRILRLDSTSFSLYGEYPDSVARQKRLREREEALKKARLEGDDDRVEQLEIEAAEEDEQPFVITITHGYSKDHRDDLKQFVLNMITIGNSRIPLWVEPLSGNAADKKSFRETILSFLDAIKGSEEPYCFVMDSAFYTAPNLEALSPRIFWMTRVPETVGFVRGLLAELGPLLHGWTPKEASQSPAILTDPALPDYRWIELGTVYAGVPQRILLVYSEKNFRLEKAAIERRIEKERRSLQDALDTLSTRPFGSREEAEKSLEALFAKARYHTPDQVTFTEVRGHRSKGRPKKGSEPELLGVTISASPTPVSEAIAAALATKGIFVLASNTVSLESVSSRDLITTYKGQGSTIEGSNRFFKDPRFYVENFFLKKEERIMALMTVMAMSLLVYALAEELLREALMSLQGTLPDQKGRPTNRPTIRWIFQLLENIHWQPHARDPAGLISIREKQLVILGYFPPEVRRYYDAPAAA